MLTRLKVNGFKNLVNVDVRFGPFTCIAGANDVGKSNLFDAIRFLSALAEMPILEAALSVRGEGRKASDIRDLFTRVGDDHVRTMSFEVEMITAQLGKASQGRIIETSATHLRYSLELELREDKRILSGNLLKIKNEFLVSISPILDFAHSRIWYDDVLIGTGKKTFIETQTNLISVYGETGPTLEYDMSETVSTGLSSSTLFSPTASHARIEMDRWKTLQLEPSVLREPSEILAPPKLDEKGSNLPAVVNRIAHTTDDSQRIYTQFSNRLSELIDDVREVYVDVDEARELLTLMLKDRSGAKFSARSLSDGTLRFLALVALEMDTTNTGLYCIEEPENGLHPARIPAMLDVLQGIAVDTDDVVDEVNPLRQVIINTHSPAVVQQVPDDSLLLAYNVEQEIEGHRVSTVQFRGLENTWRKDERPISRGDLLSYLNPVAYGQDENDVPHNRVIDRSDLRDLAHPPLVEDE
ncbi:MAG: AAA family ATPase [Chloroflexi bacterium]|nr:AAA family ATPase [Chloroflexota bacterium]